MVRATCPAAPRPASRGNTDRRTGPSPVMPGPACTTARPVAATSAARAAGPSRPVLRSIVTALAGLPAAPRPFGSLTGRSPRGPVRDRDLDRLRQRPSGGTQPPVGERAQVHGDRIRLAGGAERERGRTAGQHGDRPP